MSKARDIASAAPAPSTVSATELGYVDGVTSAIQTQIDAKQAVVSGVNDTEIGYLDGVTSAIQTQLDAKTAKSTLTTTGDIYYASAANTPARLGIGSTGNVLTVASGIPSWAAPASGGMTVIASGSFPNNTTTFTFSSIPTTYKYLILQLQSLNSSNNNANLSIRLGSGTTSHYGAYTLYSANNGNANNTYTNNSGSITAINAYQISGQIIFPAYQGFSGNKMPVSWNLIGTVLDNNNFMTSIGGGFVDGLSSYTQFSLLFGYNFSGSYQLLGVN